MRRQRNEWSLSTDPLAPSPSLLVKLGSLIVHYEEMLSKAGHAYDRTVVDQLRNDPEVVAWFNSMNLLAMLPVKR